MLNDKIPIIIVTGFLGSGKTTLLNQLLPLPELADTAVLINEFGEISLDHLLIDAIDEEIILLESGCVCCSVRDDFSNSLLTLYDKREKGMIPRFQRVILETTGIADPIAIHELILSGKEVGRRYYFEKICTVVDTLYGQTNLDEHLEAIKQVNAADQIIVSKTDLCDKVELVNLEKRLSKLNPVASISHSGTQRIVPDILFSHEDKEKIQLHDIRRLADASAVDKSPHDQRFSTFVLRWPEAIDWEDFVAWLEALLLVRGDSIHRLKGLLNVKGDPRPTVVQGVQHSFYQPAKLDKWPDNIIGTALIFITSNFGKEAAINSLIQVLDVTVE